MFSGEALPERVLSANAYLGACRSRARSPPAPTSSSPAASSTARSRSGPLMHEFGWGEERLRPARRRQPGRPHHRMRLPGDRRPVHRLGSGARLGRHRLPDRRVPRRRHVSHHQAGGHRRPDRARRGRRAAALRDRRSRRPTCCPTSSATSAHVTIDQDGRDARPRRRRARLRADRHLQGLGDRAAAAFAPPARSSSSASTRSRKAERTGAAIVERTRRLLRDAGLADFTATHVEVIGAEALVRRRRRGRGRAAR